MQRGRTDFGTLGHHHLLLTEATAEMVAHDIELSLQAFKEHNLTPAPAYCMPDGALTKEARKVAGQLGFQYALGIGEYPGVKPEGRSATLLGRTSMFESVSFSKDFFACRLWSHSSIPELNL